MVRNVFSIPSTNKQLSISTLLSNKQLLIIVAESNAHSKTMSPSNVHEPENMDYSDPTRYYTLPTTRAPPYSWISGPVFSTGSTSWDWWLTLGLYISLFVSVSNIVDAFITQGRRRLRRSESARPWGTVAKLLICALVAIVVVTALRLEHIIPRGVLSEGKWWYGTNNTAWVSVYPT